MASLIFYGAAGEPWLRRKLRELQKCAGYRPHEAARRSIGRVPHRRRGLPAKERFRTHEAIVIPQWDGLAPMRCGRSCALKREEEPRASDGSDVPK